MGWRIGANLAKANKLDFVYDRTLEKAQKFSQEYKVAYTQTPKELAEKSDVIITMLADDNAVASIINQILPSLKGKILIDMSTISPSLSRDMAIKVKEVGGIMFNAPVIGTSVFVEQKRIVILVGGPKDYFEQVREILSNTSSTIVYMGENGMGLYAKLVNNLLLGVYVAAIGEAYNFGIRSGLPKESVAKVLAELSSARSPTTEIKMPKILSSDYSTQFATKHMRKDLEIVQKEAQNLKVVTPLSSLALQLYKMLEALGLLRSGFRCHSGGI